MNDRDCESCKKFTRNDPHESEGYCKAKRTWVDPQEGEDCKMHEFTLHSATKYKDGTPMMSEPEKTYCKTLEDHTERITINEGNIDAISYDVEDLQRKVYAIYKFLNSVDPDFFAKIEDQIRLERTNKGSNFCGNCTHVNKCRAEDGIYACELSGEIVDPDDSSCAMFEPPF